jgi:RNA polymerase sigma-70 factor (ECF subfamily)
LIDSFNFRSERNLRSTTALDEQLSDEVLITWIVQGDVAALETLYDRYAPLILGIALKITGDQPLAETVLQETFWEAWQSAAAYQPGFGSLSSWLFRIARRLAMDAISDKPFIQIGNTTNHKRREV